MDESAYAKANTTSEPDGSLKPETRIIHQGEDPFLYMGAVVPPIFQNTLFTFKDYDSLEEAMGSSAGRFIYSRSENPVSSVCTTKIAGFEGGEAALLFSSGMAAISSAILSIVKSGDHIVCIKHVYGCTRVLLTRWINRFGVSVTFVGGYDPADFEKAIRPNTRLFYLESPTTMVMDVLDTRAIVSIARSHGIKTIFDNSYATPVFQRPLSQGVDLVVHSASKYLAGHSDVVAGVCVGRKEDIRRIHDAELTLLGNTLPPFESWLLLRGLRTLSVRMERHQRNAMKIAGFLESHPRVKKVNYPGLPSHPRHELAAAQMDGTSGLMSFELDTDIPGLKRFINSLRLFRIGVSWGGFESLVFPTAVEREYREELGLGPGFVRISVGLEDPDDLLNDLDTALKAIG